MTDRCTRCKAELPIDQFVRDSCRPAGYRRTCKACHSANRRQYTELNREAVKARDRKRWAARPKPPPKPRRPPLSPEERRRRDSEYKRKRALRSYGLTQAEYEALLDSQKGVCAICHQPEPTRRRWLSIDHDHMSGRVRGLLCTPCNLALGHFKDDISIVSNALHYLKDNINASNRR